MLKALTLVLSTHQVTTKTGKCSSNILFYINCACEVSDSILALDNLSVLLAVNPYPKWAITGYAFPRCAPFKMQLYLYQRKIILFIVLCCNDDFSEIYT